MATTEKVALIFGGSGTIGSGVIKALLDNPKAPRIVTVARSPEKMESIKQKFGNVSEDKLVVVEGNVESEENAAKLRDNILAKTNRITDVVSCLGRWWQKGPVLDASFSEFREMSAGLNSHFLVAKTFLPLIADTTGSSFTFVTGGPGDSHVPNASLSMIYNDGLLRLSEYVRHEWDSKPVRVNEVSISTYVTPEASAHTVSNTVAGAGIAGVMVNSDARGKRFVCTNGEDFSKLA